MVGNWTAGWGRLRRAATTLRRWAGATGRTGDAGGVYGRFDHKSSGGNQIGNASPVGTGESHGAKTDAARKASWTDALSGITSTGDPGYIRSNGATNTGFAFTVPADPTERTLYVYCGGSNATGTLRAHLSDGSAADFVEAQSGAGSYLNLYALTYRAGYTGQTLTITYLKTANLAGTNGSVDLKAAWLVVGPPNDLPSVAIVSPTNSASLDAPADIAITAETTDSDGTVTHVEFYAGSVLLGTDSSSPYNVTWSHVAAGRYTLTARVADNLGGAGVSLPITVRVGEGARHRGRMISTGRCSTDCCGRWRTRWAEARSRRWGPTAGTRT